MRCLREPTYGIACSYKDLDLCVTSAATILLRRLSVQKRRCIMLYMPISAFIDELPCSYPMPFAKTVTVYQTVAAQGKRSGD